MPHFSPEGNDTYICQRCARVFDSVKVPSSWIDGTGNVCPTCLKKHGPLAAFLAHIGVKHRDAFQPMWYYTPHLDYDPIIEESPGYIKFQSVNTSGENDRAQADQFEQWLKQHGFQYHRGYAAPGEDPKDRRFFLGVAATEHIESYLVEHGRDGLIEG